MAAKLRLQCLFSLLLCLLLAHVHALSEVHDDQPVGSSSSRGSEEAHSNISAPPKINCDFSCSRRCMAASRRTFCMRACGTCCARCQCVPAGTYGNHNMCPCYASLTTHGRKPKCP